jgi:hypothetical protein
LCAVRNANLSLYLTKYCPIQITSRLNAEIITCPRGGEAEFESKSTVYTARRPRATVGQGIDDGERI